MNKLTQYPIPDMIPTIHQVRKNNTGVIAYPLYATLSSICYPPRSATSKRWQQSQARNARKKIYFEVYFSKHQYCFTIKPSIPKPHQPLFHFGENHEVSYLRCFGFIGRFVFSSSNPTNLHSTSARKTWCPRRSASTLRDPLPVV